MRKLFCVLVILLNVSWVTSALAQNTIPNYGIFFQAVARDNFSNPAKDRVVFVESSILQFTANGTKVLTELHQTTTDGLGVFSINIGSGQRIGGTLSGLDKVDWANGPYFLGLKIAIKPLSPVSNWDYTKELIDLGASSFGTVPYAYYSGSTAGVKDVVKTSDTAAMLLPYAKASALQQTNTNLGLKVNVADSTTIYVTPTQLRAVKFDTTAIYNRLSEREVIANKSLNVTTDATSDTKYPSVRAIKSYVDLQFSNFVLADGSVTAAKLADGAVTDAKITSVSGSKVTGDIAGNAATATLAANATKLATPRTINGVAFDGTSNITIATGSTVTDANATTKGVVQLAGDLTGSAAQPVVAANAITTSKIADGAVTDAKITSVAGSKVTGDIAGNAATATLAANATKLATPRTINGVAFDGSSNITIATGSTVSDANATTKGIVQLAGDLTGTAAQPVVAANAITTSKIADGAVTDAKINAVAGSKLTGTVALANGGTGATTAAGARTNLGLVIGTDVLAQRTFGSAANNNTNDFVATTEKGANNGVATLGNDGKIPSAQIPAVSFQSATVVSSQAAMLALSNAVVGSIAIRTDNNKNYVLSSLPSSTLANWIELATPSSVTSVNGFAGPNVVLTATDINGVEVLTNKSNNIANDAQSTTKYPSVKAIKDYVDQQSSNAGVADNSITSNKINGTIAIAKGGTGATNAADARTNLGLVIGTDVMSATATTTLTGDVAGSGNGTIATTINSVGGVSSNTISTFNTRITSNTSSITTNTANILLKAPINSPAFTGTPTAPTPATSDNSTKVATTEYVKNSITAANAGISSIGNISGTSNVKGATISGTTELILTPADATNGGVLTSGAQTIAGAKTFNANVTAPNFVGNLTGNATTATTASNITATSNSTLTSLPNLNTVGTITSGTWSGTTIAIANGGTGATNAADARTNLGLTIGTDVMAANATTTLTGDVTGTGSGTFSTTLSNSGVTAGSYGSSTAIPTLTVDSKGRITSAGTVGIIAGVNSLNYTSTTSYAAGGTISGTSLTLAAADATNPGLISTGAQTIAGAKTFNANITAPNFVGDLTGNASTATNATTATTAGNITATLNNTLTSLPNLNSVGTITSGTWSGTAIAVANGGTGATTAADARTNLGLTIGTDVMAANATTTLTGDVTGTGTGSFATTLANSGVSSGTYGSSTAIPVLTVDSKGRLTSASTVGIIAGVNSMNYTSTTSYAAGGTISGTTLTLAAADAINPGLISTGAQTIAGTKTFSNTTTFNTDVTLNGLTLGKGKNSLSGNVAFGSSVLSTITTGNYNTAIGNKALSSNLTGGSNTGIGHFALLYNQTGVYNTGVGSNALSGIVSGNSNSAFGAQAMPSMDGGTGNTSIGSGSFYNILSGSNNISLGYNAAQYYTSSNLNLTNANNGIFIGTSTRAGVNSSTNEVVIGHQALGNGSNTVTIGNSSITDNYFRGNINLTGNISGGTWSGTTIGSNYGGAGTVNGLLKANGSGVVSAAVAGTDYMAANATTTLTGDVTGSGSGTFTTTINSVGGVSSSTISGFDARITTNANNIALRATIASPSFTGTPTAPTPTTGDNSTKIATTEYVQASITAASAGVSSVGPISATANANGATISGSTQLILTPASENFGGVVTTEAQTFAGAKTFSNTATFNSDINVNGIKISRGNTSGLTNIGIGFGTLNAVTRPSSSEGMDLTALGYNALNKNTSGYGNTAVGHNALLFNTFGFYNTAIGKSALTANVTGQGNFAGGMNALTANNSGSLNTAVGGYSLGTNTSGGSNTAVGYSALGIIYSSSGNTALGTRAGERFGSGTGTHLNTATNSVFIGANTRASANAITNEVVIGADAVGNGSNTVTVGNLSNTATYFTGDINLTGNVNGGTWSGTTIGSNYGGAGTVNGLLKANGSGVVSAAISGTDFQAPLTAGSGISIASGTISATGLTTANLSSTAGITNGQLQYSSTILGNTTMTLGGTVTSVTGLTSLDATNLTGTLSGTATSLATGRTIALTGDVTYTSPAFDGSGNVTAAATLANSGVTSGTYGSSTAISTFTVDSKGRLTAASTASIIADAGTLTGTTLNSTVTSSSLTGVGTITTGTWNASTISAARGGTGLTSPGTSGNLLTSNGTSWVSSPISAVTSLGTFTTTAYSNGGTITGNTTLTLSAADASNPGLLSASTQTIGGAKTFSNTVTFNNDILVNSLTIGRGNNSVLNNTAVGNDALRYNQSTGTKNTAIGYNSLNNNSTGYENTAIGSGAMDRSNTGYSNTAVGFDVMSSTTVTGYSNQAFGKWALFNLTSGYENTALGQEALYESTTGYRNVAIGNKSILGLANTAITGNNNVGVGYASLTQISSGNNNVGIGASSLGFVAGGNNNIAIGFNAGTRFGSGQSTNSATSISNNIFIGYDVRPLGSSDINQIIISNSPDAANLGNGQIGLGNNSTLIGNTATQKSQIYGALTVVPNSAPSTTDGNSILLQAQNAGTGGNNNGGNITLTPGTAQGTGTAGQIQLTGATTITGAATISNTTASTSTTSGALVVRGGVGMAGNLTVGGTIEIDGGSPGVGKVLTSNAGGLASWTSNPNTAIISVTTSTTYTVATDDKYVIYSNGTTGTITLPSAVSVGSGKEYIIKNISANSITVNTTSTQKIIVDNANNTATSVSLGIEASNNWIRVISDGTQWIGFRALF